MRQLKLIELDLENFKGPSPSPDSTWTGNFKLTPNGENIKVIGENAAGKTALFDGFLWLLFGEDSRRQSQFDVKPTREDRETSVTGKFEFEDEEFTLHRSYGDSYSYGVNGVPKKKFEFEEFLEEKFDLERLRILVDTRYFNEGIHWEDRRAILMNLVEGVEAEVIIGANSELENLDLKGLEPEDRRDQLKSEIKELEEKKENIPVQIQTLQENAPKFEDEEPDDIGTFLEFLQDGKEELVETRERFNEIIADLKSSGREAELRRKRDKLTDEMTEFERDWKREYEEKIDSVKEQKSGPREEFLEIDSDMEAKEKAKEQAKERRSKLKDEITELRDRWHEVKEKEFGEENIEKCPTCGQEVAEDLREKVRKSLNADKAKQLEELEARGDQKAGEKKKLKEEVDRLNEELGELEEKKLDLQEEMEEMEERVEKLKKSRGKYEQNEEYQNMEVKRAKIVEKLENKDEAPSDELQEKKQQLGEVKKKIDEQNEAIAQAKEYRRTLDRVGQLKAKESELAGKLETLKNQLRLVNEFVKTKANMLEDSINQKFDLVSYQLFEEYKSREGVKEVCKTLVDDVSWSTLNNAGQIKGGLDIIETLSEKWNLQAPVFIDGAESIVNIPESKSQQIQLEVRKNIEELMVE